MHANKTKLRLLIHTVKNINRTSDDRRGNLIYMGRSLEMLGAKSKSKQGFKPPTSTMSEMFTKLQRLCLSLSHVCSYNSRKLSFRMRSVKNEFMRENHSGSQRMFLNKNKNGQAKILHTEEHSRRLRNPLYVDIYFCVEQIGAPYIKLICHIITLINLKQ